MIIEIRVKNCFCFTEQVVFSLKADMRSRRFSSNVSNIAQQNILKTAGVYGPNNSGKSCLIKSIKNIKSFLTGEAPSNTIGNIFSKNNICELGITFVENEHVYSYDFNYDHKKALFTREEFSELTYDQYGNEKKNIWLSYDDENNNYFCYEDSIKEILHIISKSSLICFLIDSSKFPKIGQIKNIITSIASKIEIVDMNNIPLEKTISLMKNENNLQKRIVNFIKNADTYMDDFIYYDTDKVSVIQKVGEDKPAEKVLDIPERIMDRICLVSVYKGIPTPSFIFDSTGTKKIAALASYVIEGLDEGKILIVDELDNSLHFKLTRAIVAMFNNELNETAQLIFTSHDISLMDCKKLFRKEQIWFVHKDYEKVYLYPLSAFTAENGIRETTDIIEKYRKGFLGALPEPELINTLLDIKSSKRVEEAN